MNFRNLADILTARASTALGSLFTQFYKNNGIGFKTVKELYGAYLTKISDNDLLEQK